jgi:hypothetical protein
MYFLTVCLQPTLLLPSTNAGTHTHTLSLSLSLSLCFLALSHFISIWYKNPGNHFQLINWIKIVNCLLVLISKVSSIRNRDLLYFVKKILIPGNAYDHDIRYQSPVLMAMHVRGISPSRCGRELDPFAKRSPIVCVVATPRNSSVCTGDNGGW